MFPVLKSGERFNVISESVIIEGTIRTFSNELLTLIIQEIGNGLDLLKHEGFEVDFLH
jgi:metal-dependent amidase/aminoacylase/carboxypeptidase family protein